MHSVNSSPSSSAPHDNQIMNQTWERTCSFHSANKPIKNQVLSQARAPPAELLSGRRVAVTVQGAQGVSTQSGEGTRTTWSKDDT